MADDRAPTDDGPGPGPATSPMMVAAAENHRALAGRGPEALRLAEAVRRLTLLAVTNSAPAAETAALAEELERVADALAAHVPAEPFPRFFAPAGGAPVAREGDGGDPPLGSHMPYDPVVGAYNPLALPVVLEFDPPKALGRARFTTPYEGAPGCVHGAVLSATFDIILTAANALAGATGPTVRLAFRFLRPTLLGEEALFEGWVTDQDERRVHSLGRIVQAGVVTVEAEGEFAVFDAERVARMARRRHEAVRQARGG